MKIAIIGGVTSTKILIEKVLDAGFDDTYVWGYEPTNTSKVSGWSDLRSVCTRNGIKYSGFKKVSDIYEDFRDFCPDILFAVGLSQLVPEEMLQIARVANIGFHPTALPKGRGRAPIAWIILDRVPAAATFFELGLGADEGAILAQVPFAVTDDDDATSVERKLLSAEAYALDALLPMLRDGDLKRQEQRHSHASWYGRRVPEDGCIDWSESAETISRLIRASAPPHPGAFTFHNDQKLVIYAAEAVDLPYKGVVGSILSQDDTSYIVQTGKGHLRVVTWASDGAFKPKIGARLGYRRDIEIFELRNEIAQLKAAIASLADRRAYD